VKFNTPVTKIEQSTNSMTVTLADGTTITADDVVLTAPPSVWKKIQIAPQLPASLSLQMGSAVKYVAMTSTPVWEKLPAGIEHFGDDILGMTWECYRGESDKPGVVASFSGGTFADAVGRIPAGDRLAKYKEAFESCVPGFEQHFVRDEFVDHVGAEWIKVGYSCPAPGQVLTAWRELQKPIGNLHLAGEHAGLGFSGFMEGALLSGVRVADRLCVRDGLKRLQ
jgi:monoamine oxidase